MTMIANLRQPHDDAGAARQAERAAAGAARRRGFTLIEILIVVVILGILATIVIPQFTSASQQARENTLKDDLRYLRVQLGVFKAQHRDVPPGYPGGNRLAAPSEADFLAQMMQFTDESCNTNPVVTPVFKFGPYLGRMPPNPLNGLDTIRVIGNGAAIPAADDTTGWTYKPQTQEFLANSTGNDANGTPYVNY
jgi:general secretion pathway protein G